MNPVASRRHVLEALAGGGAVLVGLGLGTTVKRARGMTAVAAPAAEDAAPAWVEGQDTPLEDLMREHAVLERIFLVYEEGSRRLETEGDVAANVIVQAAGIVRRYVEDHHERDEEQHIFPRLERVGVEVDLIRTLLVQHEAGRRLTSEILELGKSASPRKPSERSRLAEAVRLFVRMYRPHAARESTVLFAAFRKAVSKSEYADLERTLEAEDRVLGPGFYEGILEEVCDLERKLGIDRLAAFTP